VKVKVERAGNELAGSTILDEITRPTVEDGFEGDMKVMGLTSDSNCRLMDGSLIFHWTIPDPTVPVRVMGALTLTLPGNTDTMATNGESALSTERVTSAVAPLEDIESETSTVRVEVELAAPSFATPDNNTLDIPDEGNPSWQLAL
jgi:hypothetical protein